MVPLLMGVEDAFTHSADSSSVVRGRLRVNVVAFFSRMMLAPSTGRFLKRCAEVSFQLITWDQLGDLAAAALWGIMLVQNWHQRRGPSLTTQYSCQTAVY
jgi:DNA-binding transcriptional LysR family regulator